MDTFAREKPDIRAEVFRETATRMRIGLFRTIAELEAEINALSKDP